MFVNGKLKESNNTRFDSYGQEQRIDHIPYCLLGEFFSDKLS